MRDGFNSPSLDYLNNRYHDPTLGAFVSVDPLVAMTRMPYAYGNNNPITYMDPSGLCASTPAEGAACFGTPAIWAEGGRMAASGSSQSDIAGYYRSQPSINKPGTDPSVIWRYAENSMKSNPCGYLAQACGSAGRTPDFVRRYEYQFLIGRFGPDGPRLIAEMFFASPNDFFPAMFEGPLVLGGEVIIDSGPERLDAPVQVVQLDGRSFGFLSLPGHPEGSGNLIVFTFAADKFGQTVLRVVSVGPPDGKFTSAPAKQVNTVFTKNLWQEFASALGFVGYGRFPTYPCWTKPAA